jgi:hypothetical protein
MNDIDLAERDLKFALAEAKTDVERAPIQRDLVELRRKISEHQAKERALFKGAFNSRTRVTDVASSGVSIPLSTSRCSMTDASGVGTKATNDCDGKLNDASAQPASDLVRTCDDAGLHDVAKVAAAGKHVDVEEKSANALSGQHEMLERHHGYCRMCMCSTGGDSLIERCTLDAHVPRFEAMSG